VGRHGGEQMSRNRRFRWLCWQKTTRGLCSSRGLPGWV
jgi:hypothetical protein